ncbi:3-beta hydroxysteroid dehydrogenase [Mycobacterium sp. Root265]|nr:SDR family oxidoreductase [Mycobacterium sp. Root265]KRD08480.1 3-beta hydroxysteroid dehydrogenase [Mycobacterium sp. Root265]
MRVFVTGASGHIGSLVVTELLTAGHQVTGLARSDASEAALRSAGAQVRRGALQDLDVLAAGAADADGVIHLAFIHDFADYAAAGAADLAAIEAIGSALADSGKPFVTTSGTAMLAFGFGGSATLGTEDSEVDPSGPRVASENATVALAGRGVRSSVIRLAPTVHGPTDRRGFVPTLIANARETGRSLYIGDGANRWPAVHNLDAAHLYRLALETAPAGSRLHGAAESGIAFREIAQVIGDRLGVPTLSVTAEQALDEIGFVGAIAALDNPTSSDVTRTLLDWHPEHPGLLEDLRSGRYFDAA